ncbi:hypothetical protein BD769DRAFT_1390418 [Suillus cothurnatus]|nr:hypothetical protein BD769DRAFT_1390418 [Suillus cothurnatus]
MSLILWRQQHLMIPADSVGGACDDFFARRSWNEQVVGNLYNLRTAEQCAIPPLNPEAKVYRNDVEKAWQREERFSLEPLYRIPLRLRRKQQQQWKTSQELAVLCQIHRKVLPMSSRGDRRFWPLPEVLGTSGSGSKDLRAFETDNEESIQKNARRVRRELKVCGRLKHHSISPLWGVVNDFGPYPAMICPWADNGALTGFFERQQDKLSSLDKFSLLNDIALGLQYLNQLSMVT